MADVDLFGETTRTPTRNHESAVGGTDEWLTPPEIITARGPFDLDPCSPIKRPWPTAARHYTIEDDGLRHPWSGRVWLNPPYANAATWMRRLADHGTGTAFLFARTETRMWHAHIWPKASALLFLKGRVTFYTPDGRPGRGAAGAPSVLIAYGDYDAAKLATAHIDGALVALTGGGR